ncbi:hypothetical protein BXZ70DRAFT_910230 [Cristinia sonorae]|uniref:Uncharacterized protein n=1 Tax=Cristinia sonorae TaxID=1940300 RepID=A0A8K0UH82_9AGAR|nr:hypothetical protein BXZ70DRAFT_910230 [Cristinia sonorae]
MALRLLRSIVVSLLVTSAVVIAVPTQTSGAALLDPQVAIPLAQRDASAGLYSRESNAERLRRGLGPKAPTRRSPNALRPRQSPSPPTPGVITATVQGALPGFVAVEHPTVPHYNLTSAFDRATRFVADTSSSPFEIIATSGGIDAFPTTGFIKGFASSSADLTTGSSNYAWFGGVTPTPPGSRPVAQPSSWSVVYGTNEPVESFVWTIGAGNLLTPQWINTDGSLAPLTLVFTSRYNSVLITGDFDKFVAEYGADAGEARHVTFTWTPL